MDNTSNLSLQELKVSLIQDLKNRVDDKILEESNFLLLEKLINNASDKTEAIAIAELGTTYKRTGFHFDKKLERLGTNIKYLKQNDELSFSSVSDSDLTHKLIIGDNYDALLNLSISHKGKIDVIYIDPPYGKDDMGEFADTNYNNAITRDNLLSMLYPRLILAKQLLSDEGVIFCSIDDKNQAYVKCLFDDVFGEDHLLLNIPRLIKKGGKSTSTIAKNNDYIIGYSIDKNIIFNKEEKLDLDKYKYEDEFVQERGKYALTQTLDYNSLQYSKGMDYEIEIDGKKFVPGGDYALMHARHNGKHGATDWVWRWSKDAVEWGKKNKFFVVKNNRIYTKSYLYCRKKNGKNEIEKIEATKSYTTLSYVDNQYSNDNGKKEFDRIFKDGSIIFKNPKPVALISKLIEMVSPNNKNVLVLDFFAGSGTTGQAVLELNKEDGGNRTFILCTNNEITDTNPNGIAYDVTSKRLKRVMTGKCYDGTDDFEWIKKNEALGGNLEVMEIAEVSNNEQQHGFSPFDVIDEKLYGQDFALSVEDKIRWVCENFSVTQKYLDEPKREV